jgi:hypothetical protein
VNDTLTDTLTVLAQSVESLQPAGAQPAWAEIIGPLDLPEQVRWHPDLETLMGFTAAPGCDAIAAVGYGWARNLDADELRRLGAEPGGCPSLLAPGDRRRVRVVCVMSRGGDMAGYLRDGPTVLVDEPPSVGRVPDLLRRCFALPTPPPTEPTDGLLARMWLSNVRQAARECAEPLAWPAVIGRHPAIQVATEGGLAVPPGELVAALRTASSIWTWTYLTGAAASPGWLADLLPPGAAGWMDEGILSRWLLDAMASVRTLVDQVTPSIAPGAARRLRVTLGRLDLLNGPHPQPGRASKISMAARKSPLPARLRH